MTILRHLVVDLRTSLLRLALATLPALAACHAETTPAPGELAVPPDKSSAGESTPATSARETANLIAATSSIDAFDADLHGALRDRAGNLVYSPASIESALGMLYLGARGSTAAQISEALHLSGDRTNVLAQLTALLDSWRAPGNTSGPATLDVANRLYAQAGYAISPEYVSMTRAAFDAPVGQLDFTDAETSRHTINQWVAATTHDRVHELIAPGALDANVRLVLVNAMYFKGEWATRFDPSATKSQAFRVDGSTTISVPVMHAELPGARYTETSDFQVLELPYVANATRLSMVLVLPKPGKTVADVESRLSASSLADWVRASSERSVAVSLPRFHAASSFDLAPTLRARGITFAFSPASADLSGISPAKDLAVSTVFHQAVVDVDEAGSEAAAATAIAPGVAGMGTSSTRVDFTADHPFLFYIRDTTTNTVLFAGRVVDPRGTRPD